MYLETKLKAQSTQKQAILTISELDLQLTNEYGHIRRKLVKGVFDGGYLDYNQVTKIYDEWCKDDEYIILRSIKEYKQLTLYGEQQDLIDDYYWRFIKASKRGNDVYRYLVEKKFKQFEDLPEIEFFRDEFQRKKTRLLYVTLTWDSKIGTPINSWYQIPKLFNRFKANLTKNYGKIKVFRVWEATKKYNAHIHCIIYFEEQEFEVFKHRNRKGEETYRIPHHEVKKIKKYYPYNIDVQACDTFQRALNETTKYIGKYLTKDTGKPSKTNAMIWLTNKQGYGISKDFFKTIIGQNIDIEEPKPADLTRTMCNSNFDIKVWEYIGMISAKELQTNGKIWVIQAKKPPPKAMEKIHRLIFLKNNS